MQPDFQPILKGDHVVLRPVEAADWRGMFAAAADPAIWAGHPASDRYQEYAFRAFFDGALASRTAFTILDKRSGDIIGSSRYDHFDPALRQVEIGWTFLARSVWGGTYNSDVKRLMLDHAFRFVDTVVFTVGEANLRSRRAIEKIGGVLRPETFERQYGDVNVTQRVYEIRKPSTSGAAPV